MSRRVDQHTAAAICTTVCNDIVVTIYPPSGHTDRSTSCLGLCGVDGILDVRKVHGRYKVLGLLAEMTVAKSALYMQSTNPPSAGRCSDLSFPRQQEAEQTGTSRHAPGSLEPHRIDEQTSSCCSFELSRKIGRCSGYAPKYGNFDRAMLHA